MCKCENAYGDTVNLKRLTVEVDEDLHRAIRIKAIREGKTMREIVIELLRRWLAEDEDTEKKREQKPAK
jgi:predicted HicB family RNase H-like nuclease